MNVFSPNLASRHLATFLMAAAVAVPTVAAGHGALLTFRGTAVDLDGRPASGIHVHLAPVMDEYEAYDRWLEGFHWADPVATAQTDSDGRWALTATQGRLWRLIVEHPERATMTRRVEPLWGDREMSVVTLRPAATLAVRVRGPGGGAVAGARVVGFSHASTVDEWPFSYAAAATDEAGTARLRLPAEGPWSFEVVAEGLAPAQVEHAGGGAVDVTLVAGSRLDLRVRLPTGKAAARALAYRWQSGLTLAKADKRGRLSLIGAPGSRQRFGIQGVDRSLLEIELEFPTRGQPPGRHTLELVPPLRLDVQTVTAGSLDPVADAVAWSVDDHLAFGNARGRLVLDVLATEQPVLLRVSAPDHVPWNERRDPGLMAGGWTTTVVLEPAASLLGQVTDVTGRPLGQVTLEVWGERDLKAARLGRHSDGRSLRSGADGQFVLAPLPTGQRLRLLAWKPGYGTAFRELDPLAVGHNAAQLELVLAPGRGALGRVLGETGQAIPGARVEISRALGLRGSARGEPRRAAAVSEASAVSSADGRFALRDLEQGRFDLKVSAAGFVPALIPGVEIGPGNGTGNGTTELDAVRLRRSTRIAGHVVDEAGSPLIGASVSLTTVSPGTTWRKPLTIGPDGRFAFVDLAPGSYLLEAEADGFVGATSGRVDTPLTEPLRLQLHRGRALTGQVVDDHGMAVAEADISSDEQSPGRSSERARSDTAGRFELAGLAPGEHRVSIQATGFKTQRHTVFVRPDASPSVLEVALEDDLERGGPVVGLVSWPDGRPVSGADVSVEPDAREPGARIGRSTTNSSGRFRIDLVPMGAVEVVVTYGKQEIREAIQVGSGTRQVSLTLPPGVEVTGWVLGEEGEPVPAASVALDSYRLELEAVSNDDGSFALADVPPGRHRLEVRHPRFAPYVSASRLEVGTEPVAGVEARLRHGALVRGCLDTSELDTLGDFWVELDGPTDHTVRVDAVGCFRFVHVLPGTYEAEAARRRQVVAVGTFELPEGLSELEVELEPVTGVALHGRVLRGNEGVSGASVEVDHTITTATRTRADGSFVLHPVPEGEWVLSVWGAQGGRHRELVEVRNGQEVLIEVTTGEISGQVRDADTGAGLAAVRLDLLVLGKEDEHGSAPWHSEPDERVTTDSLGVYMVQGLASGRYQIRVQHKGYSRILTEVDVGSAPVWGLDLELVPMEELVLRLVKTDGHDVVEWAQVVVFDLEGNRQLSQDMLLGEGDRFRFDSIPAGRWELWARSMSTAWTRLTVDHPGEETTVMLSPGATVTFELPESVADAQALDFRITGPDGQALPWRLGMPDLHPRDSRWPTIFYGYLNNLGAGRWTLDVHHLDGRSWTATVIAEPGQSHEVELREDMGG